MKVCSTCSTKNPDSAEFCQCCGKSLMYTARSRNWLGTAKDLIQEGLEKLSEPEKRYPSQYSNFDNPYGYTPTPAAVNQPGGGWNGTLHTQESEDSKATGKKYPFFQDGDETAVAVLGESSIDADLNGTYQKSYAVLTKRRLYVKNDYGNFVSEVSGLETVGIDTRTNPFQWAFWVSTILSLFVSGAAVFVSIMLIFEGEGNFLPLFLYLGAFVANIAALMFRTQGAENKMIVALFLGSFGSGFVGPIFAVLYTINKRKADSAPAALFISCRPNKFFFFSLPNYPRQEIDNFYRAAIQLGAVSRSSSHSAPAPVGPNYGPYGTPPSYRNGGGATKMLVAICALLIIAVIGFFIYYSVTHCKVSGCGNEVYKDGYCTRHYTQNAIDRGVGNAFDYFSN